MVLKDHNKIDFYCLLFAFNYGPLADFIKIYSQAKHWLARNNILYKDIDAT